MDRIVEAIQTMFVESLQIAPENAAWLAIGLIGISIALLCGGAMWAFMKIGEGAGNLLTSAGTSLENLSEGARDSVRLTAEGVKNLLSTPQTALTAHQQIELARIASLAEKGELILTTEGGRQATFRIQGEGANRILVQAINSLPGPAKQVYGTDYNRLLGGRNENE